jgi:hypothetical protein
MMALLLGIKLLSGTNKKQNHGQPRHNPQFFPNPQHRRRFPADV